MRLIDNWRQAHRLWSVRLLALAGAVAALEPLAPQLAAVLPERWYGWAMLAVAIARLIKQEVRHA